MADPTAYRAGDESVSAKVRSTDYHVAGQLATNRGGATDGLDDASKVQLFSTFEQPLADGQLPTEEPRTLPPMPAVLVRAHPVHLWADPPSSAARATILWTVARFRHLILSCAAVCTHRLLCFRQQSKLAEEGHTRGPKKQ